MGRPLRKRTLGRPGRRWECNTKMDLKGVSCEDVKWMELAVHTVSWQAFTLIILNPWTMLPRLVLLSNLLSY
jgi:hypothetical protein